MRAIRYHDEARLELVHEVGYYTALGAPLNFDRGGRQNFFDAPYEIGGDGALGEVSVFIRECAGIVGIGRIGEYRIEFFGQVVGRLFGMDQQTRAHLLDAPPHQELFELIWQKQQGFSGQQKAGGGVGTRIGHGDIGIARRLSQIKRRGGVTRAWRCLFAGGTFVLPPANWTPEELLRCVDQHHVTYLACRPMHIQILLKDIRGDAPRLPGIRVLRCGTSPLQVSILQEARRRITPNLCILYGTSEAGAIAAAPPALLDRYPDCVGLPMEGIDLEIVDDSDRLVAIGSLGHVRARGAGIGPRQLAGALAEDASGYKSGWYYPGDVGVLNAQGRPVSQGPLRRRHEL